MRHHRALLLTLVLAALAFSRAFSSGYVSWDDDRLIVNNAYLEAPFSEAMRGLWTGTFEGDYFPIPLSTYWLEMKLWGYSPLSAHLFNWLLHLANITLLYMWLTTMKLAPGPRFLVVAVFAVHPLQVESVLWLSERKGLLGAFFLFVGLLAYERARTEGEGSIVWTLLWTAFFALSCLCKTTAVLLPIMLVVYARYSDGRSWADAVRPNRGVLLLSLCFIAVRYLAYASIVPGTTAAALSAGRWLRLPILVPAEIGHYVSSFFVPVHLSIIYLQLSRSQTVVDWSIGSGLLVLIAWQTVRRRQTPAAFFGLWFFVMLLPVLNIVPRLNFVNDRYMYLPIVGLAGFCAALADSMAFDFASRRGTLVVAALMLVMACGSFDRSRVWRDSLSLWEDAVVRVPASQLAWNNLGLAQLERGDSQAAEQSLRKAMEIVPAQNALAYVNLGSLYLDPGKGRFDPVKAERVLQAGLEVAEAADERFNLRYNLAIARLQQKDRVQAIADLDALLADLERASGNGEYRNLEEQVRATLANLGR